MNIDINDNLLLDVVYDGKQISEIVDPIEGMRIKFTYQDEKLVRLEYADAEEVYSYSVFTRNAAGKIATVNSYILEDDYDDWSKRCQSPLFQLAFDAKSIQKMLDMNGSKGNFEMESQSAWTYSGDNIVSVVSTYDSYGETMTVKDTYEYDENPNPYFGLPYILFENVSYSKNNVTAQHTEYQISGVSISAATKNYQYTYDNKKYPVMAEETDENGNKVGTTNYTYLQ
ncbi:MAG: hypothetical protein MJZ57_08880 [Bacteroidales bacterium]|nr:hypothetical protein [Bacteroidales bacterium]